MVWLGTAYVWAIDQLRSKGPRTRVLLTVSILYASILAIAVIISMSDSLVVVALCGLGLFIIPYFTVYPTAFWTLFFASLLFVIGITYQGATLALAGQNFLAIFVGGLWAIVGGIIFQVARKTSKQQRHCNSRSYPRTSSTSVDLARQIQTSEKQSIHSFSSFPICNRFCDYRCSCHADYSMVQAIGRRLGFDNRSKHTCPFICFDS